MILHHTWYHLGWDILLTQLMLVTLFNNQQLDPDDTISGLLLQSGSYWFVTILQVRVHNPAQEIVELVGLEEGLEITGENLEAHWQ